MCKPRPDTIRSRLVAKWFALFAAWLIDTLWKREKPKMPVTISVGGKAVPLADIEAIATAIPLALRDYAAGKSTAEILTNLAPTLLEVSETAANLFLPGAGTAIGVIAYILSKSRPMTQEEELAYMNQDRFTANSLQ